MIAALRQVDDHGNIYDAIEYWCPAPGCGLHLLPIGGAVNRPNWTFDGNLDAPTLTPSVLTTWGPPDNPRAFVCHSFVRAGQVEFLTDCTHELAGRTVPLADLPEWAV